ncbi:hypothetical protein GCM10011351_19010 [Paraliobacillus quinghaiensis]|uniref:Uncharacterized protein n=1 Tax=Paraliobacillus quinghaiensis TaxID=470815 RepID=A0A917WVT6_9BACI|nr:hypothetical protein GCM10011351_19010 [Paraliobacillus quinghaiensis]
MGSTHKKSIPIISSSKKKELLSSNQILFLFILSPHLLYIVFALKLFPVKCCNKPLIYNAR